MARVPPRPPLHLSLCHAVSQGLCGWSAAARMCAGLAARGSCALGALTVGASPCHTMTT